MSQYRPRLTERQVHLCLKAFSRQAKDYRRLEAVKKTARARSAAARMAWEYGALYAQFLDRQPGNPHHPPMQARF
jgi:hypothetical protein